MLQLRGRSLSLSPYTRSLRAEVMSPREERYKPGQAVPQTGIYKVLHFRHRAAHHNTLLRGSKFPACKKCGERVRFEAVTSVPYGSGASELSRPHVMLVEGEPSMLATVTWVLEGAGHGVSTAQSESTGLGPLSARDW